MTNRRIDKLMDIQTNIWKKSFKKIVLFLYVCQKKIITFYFCNAKNFFLLFRSLNSTFQNLGRWSKCDKQNDGQTYGQTDKYTDRKSLVYYMNMLKP